MVFAVACLLVAFVGGVDARIGFPTVLPSARSLLEMTFEELPFPKGIVQHQVATSEGATVDGKSYDLGYNTILRAGDVSGNETFGLLVDKDGNGLEDPEMPGEPFISNGADFNSLIPKGDYVCMLTHFEAPRPAASYLTTLLQDPETGHLTAKSTSVMDWSVYDGLWTPCAGSVTPWQTHLGSEEYEPDAREFEDLAKRNATGQEWLQLRISAYALYLGIPDTATNAEVVEQLFPYMYGYPWEAKPDATAEGCVVDYNVKHMAAGRLALELPYVMPDKKTVYITDDGTNTMLGMYVASSPGDLSCGTLYGSKMTQTDAANGGTFDVQWILVGEEACSDEFMAAAKTTKFYDMFEAAEPSEEGDCPEGFTPVNTASTEGMECLKVVPGMEKLASRFEFRRYAAMLGATTEWSKMEGITYDHKRRTLYVAMSEVRRGMEDHMSEGEPDPAHDMGGPNDIRVAWNECGCVYSMEVDEKYWVKKMYALICGDKDANTDEFNACNKENISQPDNVAYVPGHDGLIIGEDTDAHQNDAIWYHDFASGTTTRVLSTPYGSETTSPYWYPNINGWAYMMAVVQHPYGESDEDRVDDPESTGIYAWTGYVGPFHARADSVDMAAEEMNEVLWNSWPAKYRRSGF